MMKKTLVTLVTTASTLVASFAFAASGYYSKLDAAPAALTGNAKALAVPATNITVLNYSEETIYVVVPGAINDKVLSGRSDTISHDSLYNDTHLVLQDWNHNSFFDQNVCRRAIVTVDGRPGSYHINVDRKFC